MVARPPDPRQHQLVKARGGGDIELAAKLDRRKPFRGLLASDAIIAEQGMFIFDEFTGNQHTAIGENRSQFTAVCKGNRALIAASDKGSVLTSRAVHCGMRTQPGVRSPTTAQTDTLASFELRRQEADEPLAHYAVF